MDTNTKIAIGVGVGVVIIALVVYLLFYVYNKESVEKYSVENLEHEQKSKDDVKIVMYYAPWCGACKTTMPVWDDLSKKYHPRLIKVDCDADKNAAKKNNIKRFPTIRAYDTNGKMVSEHTGSRSLESLEKFILANAL